MMPVQSTLCYLAGLMLLLCFAPQQSLCMEGPSPPPHNPATHPLQSNTPLSQQHVANTPSSASSSGVPLKDIEDAILSGNEERVEELQLTKQELAEHYKRLQYIVGVHVGKRLPKRCYEDDRDDGMFIRAKGHISLKRSMMDAMKPHSKTNVVEEMDAHMPPLKRSRVQKLVTVCGVQMPVTENNHLILRQPTYSSCGASAALMIAYDHKCEKVEKLCHVPSECHEGVPIEDVSKYLQLACPRFSVSESEILDKAKHQTVIAKLRPKHLKPGVDYVILYHGHFMILRRAADDKYILRESFCGAEYVLTAALAEQYLTDAMSLMEVQIKKE